MFFQDGNEGEETAEVSSDPTSDLVPEIQKDFQVFINLVEFTRYYNYQVLPTEFNIYLQQCNNCNTSNICSFG